MSISDDIREKLELTFDVFDRNNNGTLDKKEIKKAILTLIQLQSPELSKEEVKIKTKIVLEKFDHNVQNEITKEEFISVFLSKNHLATLIDYKIIDINKFNPCEEIYNNNNSHKNEMKFLSESDVEVLMVRKHKIFHTSSITS